MALKRSKKFLRDRSPGEAMRARYVALPPAERSRRSPHLVRAEFDRWLATHPDAAALLDPQPDHDAEPEDTSACQ
jgi:hypothetical protein